MAITSYIVTRLATATIVRVASDLSGTIFYHWYIHGAYVSLTMGTERGFTLADQERARIEVHDTNDPDYDAVANAPDGYPARRTIFWLRSSGWGLEPEGRYRLEQKKGAGSWVAIGEVRQTAESWSFRMVTPVLDDLSTYTWRIISIDLAGNDGTALELDSEYVVRTPDAPDYTATFDPGTTKVAFAAAA